MLFALKQRVVAYRAGWRRIRSPIRGQGLEITGRQPHTHTGTRQAFLTTPSECLCDDEIVMAQIIRQNELLVGHSCHRT